MLKAVLGLQLKKNPKIPHQLPKSCILKLVEFMQA